MSVWVRFNPELNLVGILKNGTENDKILVKHNTRFLIDEMNQICEKDPLDLNNPKQKFIQNVLEVTPLMRQVSFQKDLLVINNYNILQCKFSFFHSKGTTMNFQSHGFFSNGQFFRTNDIKNFYSSIPESLFDVSSFKIVIYII